MRDSNLKQAVIRATRLRDVNLTLGQQLSTAESFVPIVVISGTETTKASSFLRRASVTEKMVAESSKCGVWDSTG